MKNKIYNHQDILSVRDNFPIISKKINGKRLIFLDSAASTQKPSVVIDSIKNCYENDYSNIHRGVYYLSELMTEKYENVREQIAKYINAESSNEIIFSRGATESINLVASSWGNENLSQGDQIVISYLEHHSNIVPWQQIAEKKGATIKVIPMNDDGDLVLDNIANIINAKTKMVCITQASNALGTVPQIEKIINIAHDVGALVLLDGCQGIVHMPTDVRKLNCDFYVFSGHKIYGPSGIGVLYGRENLLERMPPYQSGGEMIDKVTIEKTTFAPLPYKFEAGTPNISSTIGLGEALSYLKNISYESLMKHESSLLTYCTEQLLQINDLTILGTSKKKTCIVSFVIDGIHPHDIGTLLDQQGIAVRVGHHCAQPVMEYFSIPGTVRASFGVYNTHEEVDILKESLLNIIAMFKK